MISISIPWLCGLGLLFPPFSMPGNESKKKSMNQINQPLRIPGPFGHRRFYWCYAYDNMRYSPTLIDTHSILTVGIVRWMTFGFMENHNSNTLLNNL
jgi:hypothetical protein